MTAADKKRQFVYNLGMSTHQTPFSFYGRYFPSHAAAVAFLTEHKADYDSDSICGDESDSLGLQCLSSERYILGFPLSPGESDTAAKEMWAKRVDASHIEANAYAEICTD